MSAKFKGTKLVYSTNPNINIVDESYEEVITLKPGDQMLYVSIDKKQRKGKKVTLIKGFIGCVADLKDLGRLLKSKCGVGGTVKDEEIIIQGDFKEKVLNILTNIGYKCKAVGG